MAMQFDAANEAVLMGGKNSLNNFAYGLTPHLSSLVVLLS